MGGVWCKADKANTQSYSSKGPFNSTISRWADNVRQAYKKPKTYHRPTRPPQKPLRSHGRLTISHPQLVNEEFSAGWRTATLVVPDAAPVAPPRKKRKRNQDLTRTAFSMDDLNRVDSLNKSTISLPDKYQSETGLDSRSSSSTLVVTPVLESRLDHLTEETDMGPDDNKENMKINLENKIEEEEEIDGGVHADEIIPVEKETLFSSRTLLQSNLGYIDKLSAISEVSTESGFDDRTDILKSSERSESVTSSESVPRETGLNILAHIQNINNVSQLNEASKDIREKTAISKKEWLQNILKEEPEPYFISRDMSNDLRRELDSLTSDMSANPNSLPTDHLHLMNGEMETSVVDESANKTPPPTPELRPAPPSHDSASANHSVLLELLQNNTLSEAEPVSSNPFTHKEESIFLTDTKTNIIYKSLSSDKLTDDYDINYVSVGGNDASKLNAGLSKSEEDGLNSAPISEKNCPQESTNPFTDATTKARLSDYSFQTPKLVESDDGLNSLLECKRSNVVTSFEFKEITAGHNCITGLKDEGTKTNPNIVVNGVDSDSQCSPSSDRKVDATGTKGIDTKLPVKEPLTKKESMSSSRRSSITDSLHEFEMSVYDMLKESKKNRDSSDEEDALKTMKTENRQ